MRLTSGLRAQPAWSAVEIAWDNLAADLRPMLRELEQVSKLVDGLSTPSTPEREELSMALRTQLVRGAELVTALERLLLAPDEGGIYWICLLYTSCCPCRRPPGGRCPGRSTERSRACLLYTSQ